MELDFGSEVNKVMFNSIDSEISVSELEFYIRDAISKWDNRVEVNSVKVTPFVDEENAGFLVDLDLKAIKFMQDFKMSSIITEGGVTFNE